MGALILAAARVPHLIKLGLKVRQYGKLYMFGTVYTWRWMRSAGGLVFAFQAPSIPGDSPPNFRVFMNKL